MPVLLEIKSIEPLALSPKGAASALSITSRAVYFLIADGAVRRRKLCDQVAEVFPVVISEAGYGYPRGVRVKLFKCPKLRQQTFHRTRRVARIRLDLGTPSGHMKIPRPIFAAMNNKTASVGS